MKCNACEKELTQKEIVYTENGLPYCVNPFTCNEDHPNSPKNIIARLAAVKMFSEEELEYNLFEKLNLTNEMKERVLKMSSKPQSIRINRFDIAHYLIQLQEVKELSSISEAVRYCVQMAMKAEPIHLTRK